MTDVAIAIGLEIARLALQSYFHGMRLAGKTKTEIIAYFMEQKAEFEKRNPADLPDA